MNKKKLVSCILTTYNRASLLKKAINSIRNQSFTNLEIIVVDDFSIDNTSNIVNNIQIKDNRIKYVKNKINKGVLESRNIGINISNGTYIAFLDDDDEWDSKKIEIQLKNLDKYSMISCIPKINIGNKVILQKKEFEGDKKIYYLNDILISTRHFYPSGILTKKKYIEKINYFDTLLHEWDFFIKLVKNIGPAIVLEYPLVYFNRNKKLNRYSKNKQNYLNQLKVINKYREILPKISIKKRYSSTYFNLLFTNDILKNKLNYLKNAIKYDKKNIFKIIKKIILKLWENIK